jgi:hypothetical protein
VRVVLIVGLILAAASQVAAAPLNPYAAFCQSPTLEISPAGRYLFARRGSDALSVVSTDCLLQQRADCPVSAIVDDANFPRGGMYFSDDDQWIYMVAAGTDSARRVTGDNTIRKFATRAVLGTKAPPVLTAALPTQGDVMGYLEPRLALGTARDAMTLARSQAVADRAAVHKTAFSANARNLYGLMAGDRSIYLFRSDVDYSVGYSLDGAPERRLWGNGNPFSQRRANLAFKFDGRDAVVQASGSILRITPKGLVDLTPRRSRSVLINGDDPSRYYGYGSAEGLVPQGVPPELAAQLKASAESHADQHMLGLAFNQAIGATVYSYGPFRAANSQAIARHEIRQGERRVEISCGGEVLARHAVRRVGGAKGVFVERYSREGARRTVLYLSGGPGLHENLETSASNDLSLLLDNGFNVDVIHYGGSDYTFAQFDRLYRGGPASIETDARLIERYVRETYGPDDHLSLYAASFGAYFYRRFDDAFLKRMDHVVLSAPAGTMSAPSYAGVDLDPAYRAGVQTLSAAVNRALWGPGTMAAEANYFRGLRRCPLRGPVTIVVGAKDDVVRPLEDYRLCLNSPRLTIIRHEFDHVSPLTPGRPAFATLNAQTLKALGRDEAAP